MFMFIKPVHYIVHLVNHFKLYTVIAN